MLRLSGGGKRKGKNEKAEKKAAHVQTPERTKKCSRQNGKLLAFKPCHPEAGGVCGRKSLP